MISLKKPSIQRDAHEELYSRIATAEATDTASEVLVGLANDDSVDVRYAVASNPATPPAVLELLALSPEWEIRLGVASNHQSPASTLRELSKDGSAGIRAASAENSSLSLEALCQLILAEKSGWVYDLAVAQFLRNHQVQATIRETSELKEARPTAEFYRSEQFKKVVASFYMKDSSSARAL